MNFFLEIRLLLVVLLLVDVKLLLKLADAGGATLAKRPLGSTVLCLALGGRRVGGGLAAGLGARRDDPFLGRHGNFGSLHWGAGGDDGGHGHLIRGRGH